MNEAITVGQVLGFVGIVILALGIMGIIVGVLWFMAQGWNH